MLTKERMRRCYFKIGKTNLLLGKSLVTLKNHLLLGKSWKIIGMFSLYVNWKLEPSTTKMALHLLKTNPTRFDSII